MTSSEFQELRLKPGDIAVDKDLLDGSGLYAKVKMIELSDYEKRPGFDYYGGSCLFTTDENILVIGYCCVDEEQRLIHQRTQVYSPRTQFPNELPEINVLDMGNGTANTTRPTSGPIYEAHQKFRKEAATEIMRYEELKKSLSSPNPNCI